MITLDCCHLLWNVFVLQGCVEIVRLSIERLFRGDGICEKYGVDGIMGIVMQEIMIFSTSKGYVERRHHISSY